MSYSVRDLLLEPDIDTNMNQTVEKRLNRIHNLSTLPNALPEHSKLAMLCHATNYMYNPGKIGNRGYLVVPAFFQSVWEKLGFNTDNIAPTADRMNDESGTLEGLLSFL